MSAVLERETQQQAQEAPEQVVPSHIVIGADGQARVAGTGYKVRLVMGGHRYHEYGPKRVQEGYPDLTMAQVYSLFSYYYDHKAEIDAAMDHNEATAEKMRLEAGEAPVVKRLKEAGLLPIKHTLTDEQLYAELEEEQAQQV